ncbi:MAG: glycosyltransferase family 2 protein [Erysipelotrichales bacterium]|nr:glycosyltransferase family 2 protein [Erysipelotrichales bacterium]
MSIGFVIVNYNDSKNTIKLINSIKDFNCIKRIVVVDNNSSDKQFELLERLEINNLKIIRNKENYGYAKALNVGAKYVNDSLNDPIICMSNSDVLVESEDVIKTLANMINDDVKCVMPKIKEGDNFAYGWKSTNAFLDLVSNIPLINRAIRDKVINYDESYFNKESVVVDVPYGCFFLIDGTTLKNIGYFDEKTFLYYEEYILAKKLKRINKLTMLNTTVYVSHIHDAVIGNNLSKLNKYKAYKKSQLYYEKEYNNANFIEMLLFKIFYLFNLIPYKLKSKTKK